MRPLHFGMAALLLLAGAFFLYSGQVRDRYQEPAARYLATALTDISRWQPAAIERHLAPAARAAITEEQIAALVARYRHLGSFQRIDNLEFARISVLGSLLGQQRLLNYGGDVQFVNGRAHLTATLAEQNGELRLYNFNLSSPAAGTDSQPSSVRQQPGDN